MEESSVRIPLCEPGYPGLGLSEVFLTLMEAIIIKKELILKLMEEGAILIVGGFLDAI